MLDVYASAINDGKMVNRVGLSRKHIFDAVQNSVRRLGTYIDVLQIHRMDEDVGREEIMRALNDVVERGWVRYLGASSVSVSLRYGMMWKVEADLLVMVDACVGVPDAAEYRGDLG